MAHLSHGAESCATSASKQLEKIAKHGEFVHPERRYLRRNDNAY